MSGLRVLFRLDGSRRVGLGHLMRAFALAARMTEPGDRAIFICRSAVQLYPLFAHTPYRVYYVSPIASESTVARSIRKLGLHQSVDMICIDIPPDLSAAEMDEYTASELPVVLFDDHGPAVRQAVMTINALAHPEHLKERARNWEVRNGPAFVVLDDAYRIAAEAPFHESPQRLLIAMGGADPHNISSQALRALLPLSRQLDLHLLLGPAFGFHEEIERLCSLAPGPVNIDRDLPPAAIPAYLAGFDLAVMSFGITVYGAAHLGLPSIVLGHDDAGARAGDALEQLEGFVRSLGRHDLVDDSRLLDEVAKLLSDARRRRTMRDKGRVAVDGESAGRIIDLLRGTTGVSAIRPGI